MSKIDKKQKLKFAEIIDRIKRYGDRFRNAGDDDGMDLTSKTLRDLKKCKQLTRAIQIEEDFKEKVKNDQMSKLIIEFIGENGKPKENLKNLILFLLFKNSESDLNIRELNKKILDYGTQGYDDLSLFQIFITVISLNSLGLIVIDDKNKHYTEQKYKVFKPTFQKYFNINWQEYYTSLHELFKDQRRIKF